MAKRPPLSQIVQDYLRDYIIREKLRSGDPLPSEGQIAADLEISRVSVREGVKILATMGVIEVRHGEGLYVGHFNLDVLLEVLSYSLLFDLASLRELQEVRKFFAVGMMPDIIQRLQPETLRTCRQHLQEWEQQITSGSPFYEQDHLFHLTLTQSVGNHLMVELENIFWNAYRNAEEQMNSLHMTPENARHVLAEHRNILDAIEARAVESAQRLMAKSFEEFRTRWDLTMQKQQQK